MYIISAKLQKNLEVYLVEAVVLARAEDLLDVGVRGRGVGWGRGSVRGSDLITGVVGSILHTRLCLRSREGARLDAQLARLELLKQLLPVLPGDLLSPAELLHHADALLQHLPPPLLLLGDGLPPVPGRLAALPLEQISQRVLKNAVAARRLSLLACQTSPLWGLAGIFNVLQNVLRLLGVESEYALAIRFVPANELGQHLITIDTDRWPRLQSILAKLISTFS